MIFPARLQRCKQQLVSSISSCELRMPRLLPRLLRRLEIIRSQPGSESFLYRPQLQEECKRRLRRGATRAVPSFNPRQRRRSVLLDTVNPILHKSHYIQRRSPPAPIRIHSRRRFPGGKEASDGPRVMSAEERSWWSNPWLRMLSSPIRRCILTGRTIPADFMIRLAPFRLSTPRFARPSLSFLPDGLEHKNFKKRKAGHGQYVVCEKTAIAEISRQGKYKRFGPNLTMHHLLDVQIGHLLRIRVIQELDSLAEQLQRNPQNVDSIPIIRKLTREEFREVKETGVIRQEGAVAVLVVPPPNRNPTTKMRPKASLTPEFYQADVESERDNKSTGERHPSHVLCTTEKDALMDNASVDLPNSKVPLYNGATLFPVASQRAALQEHLSHALAVERRSRQRGGNKVQKLNSVAETKAEDEKIHTQKASHAYLLRSDAETVKRADTAALAIALWRLRLWEGAGWDGENSGWVLS